MKTVLKIVAAVVVLVVVLVVGAAVVLPIVIDPNEHKGRITALVEEHTGRALRIEGDISLSFFPWLGLETGRVELSNAPGFEPALFASTDRVDVRVKLLPLLSREVEMSTVTLHGLSINLARDAEGRTNWSDLVQPAEPGAAPSAPPEGPSGGPGLAAIAVGGLDVRDAALSWRDAVAGRSLAIRDLDLRTGALAFGEPVDLELGFEFEGGEPRVTGRVDGAARVEYASGGDVVRLAGLKIDLDAAGEHLPGGKAQASLTADAVYDAAKGTATVENLALEAMDLEASGRLAASGLAAAPRYEGTLEIPEFDPREMMAALGVEPPRTADAEALGRVSASLALAGDASSATLEPLTVKLDDSTLSGRLAVADFARRALRFDLELDAIDLDRYLPPKAEGGGGSAPASPGTAAAGAGGLPLEPIRALDVDGRLRAGRVGVAGLTVTELSAQVRAKDGVVDLEPLAAELYEGTYSGDIALDARGDVPRLSIDERLAGIQAGPLLEDLIGEARLTGTGDVSAKLTASGVEAEAFKRSLNGRVEFLFNDGTYNGVNIAQMIRDAMARLKGGAASAGDAPQKTDFAELGGTVNIVDGVATNEDLHAKTPLLRIEGGGRASLPEETVDYTVRTSVVATTKGQGGAELGDLAGVTIPVRVTGTFAAPKYGIDFDALASAVAKSKAGAVVEEQKAKVEERIEEKAGGKVKELLGGDEAKGALKGLLGND